MTLNPTMLLLLKNLENWDNVTLLFGKYESVSCTVNRHCNQNFSEPSKVMQFGFFRNYLY